MAERMLVATRKGLSNSRARTAAGASSAPIFPASRSPPRCTTRATARSTPCSSTAISAPSCIAPTTTAAAGPNCRRRLSRPMPPASPTLFQIWTIEAGGADEPGRLWAGALPAGLFVSSDRGEHWSMSARCGMCRSARNGSAAAMTMPASTPSRPIRATPSACSSPSPAAACGIRPTAAKAGLRGDGHGRRLYAAGTGGPARNAGPASGGALRRRARH